MYTMCPPGCYHNGFMATPELGHRMYGYTLLYNLYIYTIDNISLKGLYIKFRIKTKNYINYIYK